MAQIVGLTREERAALIVALPLLQRALGDPEPAEVVQAEAVPPAATSPTLDELWAMYERIALPELADPRTESGRAKKVLGTVIADGRRFGTIRVADLRVLDADEYRAVRRTETTVRHRPTTAATRNREVVRIQAMLTWARKRKIIGANPWESVPPEKEAPERSTVIEPEQFERYANELDLRVAKMMLLAYQTGMRLGEVRKLRKDCVDFDKCVITLSGKEVKGKRQGRIIPILEETRDVLRAGISDGSPWVFPSERTGRPYDPTFVRKCHRQAVARAGITAADGVWVHDLRASWVTLVGELLRRAVTKAIAGHSTDAAHNRYDRLRAGSRDADAAREAIRQALTGPRKGPQSAPPAGDNVIRLDFGATVRR